jgi:gamma-glutamylcyclotransferase (GGCT)/AIG2-like uncharacterized protein YtfP
MNDLLFVYGTLSPSRAPAHLCEIAARLKPLSPGSMPGRLYDLGEFPGAVFDAAAPTRVYGEVFELPSDSRFLSQLDDYEGFMPADPAKSLFVREQRPVVISRGAQLSCWVYLYNRDPGHSPLIHGGDYSTWTTSHHASRS